MEDPQRPLPPRSLVDRVRSWTEWIGYGRIVGSALAMVIVCAGGYWLMRMPPPPTEASLPFASTSTAVPSAPAATSMVATATSAAVSSGGAMEVQVAGVDRAGGDGAGVDAQTPMVVVVHVAGAVVAPGVYELPADSRTEQALIAAGGPVVDADPNALNLAAPLVDGSRIYVPVLGEVVPPTSVAAGAAVNGRANASGGEETGPINVNQASAADLEELPGVGPATAAAIVSERDRNGPFLGVDDLDRVPGIGPTKIEALRDLVTT